MSYSVLELLEPILVWLTRIAGALTLFAFAYNLIRAMTDTEGDGRYKKMARTTLIVGVILTVIPFAIEWLGSFFI